MAKSKFDLSNPKVRYGSLAAVSLLLAYLAASWAIDSGSLWLYLLTMAFCYVAITYISRLIGAPWSKKKK